MRGVVGLACLIGWMAGGFPARAEDSSPSDPAAQAEAAQFFENKVRPILVNHCYSCHGPEKTNGSLRLDSLQGMLEGGESGPAVVPGKPDESLIVGAINYESLEMPPTGKLPEDQIAVLVSWVKGGAVWPGAAPVQERIKARDMEVTDADRQWWSFRPPALASLPSTTRDDRAHNPIDRFLQARLDKVGLSVSASAPKRTLLRRLSFDLIGLPPSPQEMSTWEEDSRADAYDRQVDRLLASPQFGERWGRHWLDVVRFAQTNGYERDAEKPESGRYRDYVIGAFNEDLPYDQFLREQLAGDEIEPVTDGAITATGFGRLGVWDDEPDDKANAEFEHYDDLVSTFGQSMLGLTVGCARCHDHKFDPLPQRDYYGLVALFRGVQQYEKFEGNKKDFTMLAPLSSGDRALAMREAGPQPPATHVLARGDARSPGKEVAPHFPEVLFKSAEECQPVIPTPDPAAKSSGRRRALAEWVTQPNHPLTARVMVNRLWHHHFGRGIVATPSDFGKTGSPPSHPELLDWLACELVDDAGWRLKSLHRLIVSSAAYRQTSQVTAEGERIDPANELVWRQSVRRLDAESMRDQVLFVNGELSLEMGGRGFFPKLPKEVLATQSIPGNGWGTSSPAQQHRRSVYIFSKRTLRVPLIDAFDAATPDQSIAARSVTTIAPQALALLNGSFMEEESLAMADRLLAGEPSDEARVDRLFKVALQRAPSPEERSRALAFVTQEETDWGNLSPSEQGVSVIDRWNRLGGTWTPREDGGIEVAPDAGAKILWPTGLINQGTIETEVMLLSEEGDADVLFRVVRPFEEVDGLVGYNVSLTPKRIRLGKHQNSYAEIASAEKDIAQNAWHRVKIQVAQGRIQVTLDDDPSPVIDAEEASLPEPGQVGFRTYQAHAAFRGLRVTSEQGTWTGITEQKNLEAEKVMPNEARRRAWADWARVVFNSNEFVYVD